jgi:hypothetical protein
MAVSQGFMLTIMITSIYETCQNENPDGYSIDASITMISVIEYAHLSPSIGGSSHWLPLPM